MAIRTVYKLAVFLLSFTVLVTAACKVRIVVPEGGKVNSLSGAYTCHEEEVCDIDVVDFFFDETFVADPLPGYKFKFWKRGPGRFCGWNKEPCRIHTAGFGNEPEIAEAILPFLESEEVLYLQPVFIEGNTCTDRIVGFSNEFTLRQGESTVREVLVPYLNLLAPYSTYFEKCPKGMCSSRLVGRIGSPFYSDSRKDIFDRRELAFSTEPHTPIGTYDIHYVAYSGGFVACGPTTDCTQVPLRVKKRWKYRLTVIECPP